MKKKVFMMMTALLCMMAQSVRADKWDGVTYEEPEFSMNWYITCDIETLEGGTSFMKNLQTLTIRNAAQMAYVQKYFCHERTFGTETVVMSSAVLVLETDLDMGDWKPLGSYDSNGSVDATKFTGTFFGNGHTIRINIKGAQANFQGLFRHIGEGGTVRDLHIAGNIDCSGSRLVGGIAGENDGTINNCWVSADVSSGWHNSASATTQRWAASQARTAAPYSTAASRATSRTTTPTWAASWAATTRAAQWTTAPSTACAAAATHRAMNISVTIAAP